MILGTLERFVSVDLTGDISNPIDEVAGCGRHVEESVPGTGPIRGVDYATAKQVANDYEQEIRRRYRDVQGMGITGMYGDGDFVIEVWLKFADDVPEGPQSIAGVPLVVIATGEFSISS